MKVRTDVRDGVGIVICKGKMLIGEGDELLREAVNDLLECGRSRILLDLSAVPYVDACGLGEIVRCYTSASRKGGTIALIGLNKRLTDLLTITKLLIVFKVYQPDDRETAIRDLSQYSRGS